MSDSRAFDDDRWPSDHDGYACCFWCGRKVDPLDPKRGSYTPNHRACESLPVHLACMEGNEEHMARVLIAAKTAVNQMGNANIKKAREAAKIASGPGN